MSANRLDGRMHKAFAELWAAAVAHTPTPDPAVTLAGGQVRQGRTQELLPECAQVLAATGTAGPADEWPWAVLIDAAAAAGAEGLAPLVAPSLREPDGSMNALMGIAAYTSTVSDAILASLGADHHWQVMQGWQGLLERGDLRELEDGAMAEAPGMEALLVPSARPVLAEVLVQLPGAEDLRISFLLDAAMALAVLPPAAPEAPARPGPAAIAAAPEHREEEDAAGAALSRAPAGPVAVHRAAFEGLRERHGEAEVLPAGMALLMDVPLQLTVELGRTRRIIREVLAIAPGAVVELDRLAGEPVDVLINGKLLGKGEVVVINENFGVRITDIISQAERLRGLE